MVAGTSSSNTPERRQAATVSHRGLGISVLFEDYIDLARNWFIRNLSVTSAVGFTVGRVFLHYDWCIEGSDIGNTVLYDPRHRGVIAYKANRYLLVGGQCDAEYGVSTWANGKKGNGLAGTGVDNRGAVIASSDFDITKFARDTYAYAWPRDGALVANALDRCGHEDVTRQFFLFCQQTLVEEGFFLHKYTPYGQPGSSWLPWVDSHGARTLPIQEDETGLVLWSLWQHYRIHRNLDFVVDLYTALIVPAADWMLSYVDQRNGLPIPSWDLWEERWGVHAFTVGSVWGGLDAARSFADMFGDVPAYARYRDAAERLREASDTNLYSSELGRFPRRITVEDDESVTVDTVLDSAIHGLWRFGMYPPEDQRIADTMKAIADQLSNKAEAGGIARYTDDYYFRVEPDTTNVPGNPWFLSTLLLAQWYIATAKSEPDLKPAREMIDWAVRHQMPGGLLSEQLDPHTGAPLSVSPLTWSHAEFIVTVDEYCRRADLLRGAPDGPI